MHPEYKHLIHKEDDFLGRLQDAYPRLAPVFRKLAAYVAENYRQVAFLSSRQLAVAAGVSSATVVRFAWELGYAGFGAMRAAIQERLNFELTATERLHMVRDAGQPVDLPRRIIEADIANLRLLQRELAEPRFDTFVRAVCQADRILVVGFRFLRPVAEYFAYSLNKVRPGVRAITAADSTVFDELQFLTGRDLMVLIAFARYPRDILALARRAAERGIPVAAITDSRLSPVIPFAQCYLIAKSELLDFAGSLVAPMALVNCVVSEAGMRLGDAALARLEQFEEAAEACRTYVSPDGSSADRRSRDFLEARLRGGDLRDH